MPFLPPNQQRQSTEGQTVSIIIINLQYDLKLINNRYFSDTTTTHQVLDQRHLQTQQQTTANVSCSKTSDIGLHSTRKKAILLLEQTDD